MTFALTRVERSLFYPAVGPIGINEIYTSSMIVVIVTRQIPPSSFQENRLLPAERAALGQTCLTTGRLAPSILLAPFLSVFEMRMTYRTCEQPWQTTTVLACEKTVVMVKHPGHLTSMKNERGAGTRVLSLCFWASLGAC